MALVAMIGNPVSRLDEADHAEFAGTWRSRDAVDLGEGAFIRASSPLNPHGGYGVAEAAIEGVPAPVTMLNDPYDVAGTGRVTAYGQVQVLGRIIGPVQAGPGEAARHFGDNMSGLHPNAVGSDPVGHSRHAARFSSATILQGPAGQAPACGVGPAQPVRFEGLEASEHPTRNRAGAGYVACVRRLLPCRRGLPSLQRHDGPCAGARRQVGQEPADGDARLVDRGLEGGGARGRRRAIAADLAHERQGRVADLGLGGERLGAAELLGDAARAGRVDAVRNWAPPRSLRRSPTLGAVDWP